ncbi:g12772 [Coccomyxa viridis]|uniref:G12772 protein n=1 Tax=Coccomyxa viridis TaxID=1274662 RepID=A0ABP1GC68_9CHLO
MNMALSFAALAAIVGLVCVSNVAAVRNGDEVFQTKQPRGAFYVFADKAIHVVDPQTLKIQKNITVDQTGAPLTNAKNKSRTWNDVAFVEDAKDGKYYVFANEGDIYTDAAGNEFSYVTVIDTQAAAIVGRVQVGALPVHGYSIPQLSQFWAHSDINGTFNVINVTSINATAATVADFKTNTGHGKLLLDDSLYPEAYATNVNEQVIEQINLPSQNRTNSFNYSSFLPDPTICTGTHSVGYSNISQHAFFECADNKGIFEWNTVTNTFVKFFANITGYVSVAPGDDEVLVVGYDSNVNVLKPQANNVPAVPQYTFLVSGDPDLNPVYWSPSNTSTDEPAGNYYVYLALKQNTNIYNLQAAAKLGLDVTDDSYTSAPGDCQYANSTATAKGGRRLLHGGDMDMDASSPSGKKLATGASNQVLTPQCGACAPGVAAANPKAYNASMSGLAFVSLATLQGNASANTDAQTTLISAGAVAQTVNGDSDANQCSYGESSRAAKRGGPWIATVADFPQPSLYIINAANQSVHGFVATASHPTKIAWVPSRFGNPPVAASSVGRG